MLRLPFLLLLTACLSFVRAQAPFEHFFKGDTSDVSPTPFGGTVLMGGADEQEDAMRWFLRQCNGGDVVVLRASGRDGYNNYLFSALAVRVNSVETIVTTSRQAADDPYVARQIRNAEALWIAGGDQANYVNFWKDGPVEEAIRYLIHVKHAPVGGTSAGMAILGEAYFAALNGTVYPTDALANPYAPEVSIGYADFLDVPFLNAVITDTHYDARERNGRHAVFLARLAKDYGIRPRGIACEEQVAICIDTQGIAHVFGNYPAEQDFAYFIQVNPDLVDFQPEKCSPGEPLNWLCSKAALRVCKIPGRPDGANTFDLRDWRSAAGEAVIWQNWWVENGVLHMD